jgi:NADPH:quinone reductase
VNVAVSYTQTGEPDVLHLLERPDPQPGPGEVVVEIHRSGVNPTDFKSRQGSRPGESVDPPQVPGQDGAGVVRSVGPGVEAALVGLRVWVWEAAWRRPEGTTQQFAVVPARQVVTLPDSASYDLGASLGIPFLTAHRCLTVGEHLPTRLGPGTLAGRTVLVAGGAGAVGNAAIQLARWSDATVLATVSSASKAHLAALAGADHVINYRQQDAAAEIRKIAAEGVQAIVEVAPATNATLDADVLAANGSIASYATEGGRQATFPLRPLMMLNARLQLVLVYTVPSEAKARAVEDVAAAVLDGAIRVGADAGLPLHHFSLDEAAEAHAAVEASAVGKVLIDVTAP